MSVPALVGSGLVPVVAVAAAVGAISAAGVWRAAVPARASLSGSVLILSSSVNGGSSSAEASAASALGLTVTVDSPSAWDGLAEAGFASYSAIIIGDPSASSCASSVPSDALSTAGTWGPAVTGNVAVLGTAPALGGATTLMSDAIAYAASGSGTGLYVSLNCEYASAGADTAVPLLADVDGGGFTVTGQSGSCSANAGSVNAWQALALSQFNGLVSGDLGPWSSPACSVEETFTGFPAALGGVGYLAGASPATFTASDGTTGQAYVLAGAPASSGTAALAPTTGGQVPAGAVIGGANPAAPGVVRATAGDPVDTENGDFTESDADVSIPAFGPALDFDRTYDADLAEQETAGQAPGAMGYGWTDDWATSLSAGSEVPGDIYTVAGLQTDSGSGTAATSQPMDQPGGVLQYGGNIYVADSAENRVLEVAGSSGTQWGISMTAGDMYVIAGSPAGAQGHSANGTAMASSLLDYPVGLAMDSSGDLYICDLGNNRVVEIPAASGSQRGISMTAGDVYTIAGHWGGASGHGGDGGAATSAYLNVPSEIAVDSSGDVYIADALNNRVQEVAGSSGTQWGQSMTANDIYTVAGSTSGSSGTSPNGTAAGSALFRQPYGLSLSSSGDLYIADTNNSRVIEVPKSSGTQWGISMTADDIYTVAGSQSGTSGSSGDGGAATSAKLDGPSWIKMDNGTQLYIADSDNNKIREVARTTHTEWGQSMTANDIYTIAGTGSAGFSGDGGAATSAKLSDPDAFGFDSSVSMYVADQGNNRVREVSASTADISEFAGDGGTLASVGDGGPALGSGLYAPVAMASDGNGDVFVADFYNNRVQELAAYGHAQFGISMTAGDVYTVAGSALGKAGKSGDGGLATSALLSGPAGVAVDSSGNLYIADGFNNRIQEVSASTGDISTIAGSASGSSGDSGQGGPATSALLDAPDAVAVDGAGDVFIAGNADSQVYEVPAATGGGMTAGDLYTIAGSTSGTSGHSGNGGPATSALLDAPDGVAVDAAGNAYISDSQNNNVREVAATTHRQWGRQLTAGDIYDIAGSGSGTGGDSGDGAVGTAALLFEPGQLAVDSSGNLYVGDAGNNQVREIAAAGGTQWGQQMDAGYIYDVAGSELGDSGYSGDGGPAASALLTSPAGLATDPAGDLFIGDGDNHLREVVASTGSVFPVSPSPTAVTISQAGGSQVTFYPDSGGCTAPYAAVSSGQYCTLPQNVDANLSYSGGTFTYTPAPGQSYTYNTAGQLTGEADSAGDTLTVAYGTPLPGSGNCPSAASWCQTITSASGRALTIGYNSSNLITSVTDPMGREWTYGYASSDLTSATDPAGNVTTYTYGEGGNGPAQANDLLTITSPNAQPGGPDAGDDTVNAYDNSNRVTRQVDPMGWTTTFAYNIDPSTGTGTTTITDPDGNATVDAYNAGSLIAESDWTGGTTKASETDYLPAQTTSGTSAGTQLDVATADGDGNIATTSYDANGYATATTAPDGVGSADAETTQQFTALGNADCESTEEAASTCQSSGGPSPVAPGGVITPPSSVPPQGVSWTLYDTDGNELYTTSGVYPPGGSTASYAQTTYQLFNGNSVTLGSTHISCAASAPSMSLPCAAIDADGVVTQLAYDSAGDLTSSSAPDGNGSELATTTYGYDGDGEQTSIVSPDGNLTGANAGNYTTVTAYDADGLQTSVTQAGGSGATVTPRTTSYGYDGDGNQTTVQDARGYTTTTAYNADDQATVVTNPASEATLTCYDGTGEVTQTVPAVGVAANSLTPGSCPTSYPSGYGDRLASDATTYAYDSDGDLTSTTTPAPAGQSGYETTSYVYDGAGDLVKTTAPATAGGGSSLVTTDSYNAAGEVASQTTGYGTSAASTVSYCYDPNGDTTSVVYPDGNSSGTAPCEASYPWVVSSASHPTQAGYQTTYGYDSAGELVSTTTPATSAAPSGATTSATYDAAGNQLTSVDPDGVTTTWTYTPLDEAAAVSYSGGSAHSVSYGYDADGNVTSMADGTGTSSYAWDPFGGLTSVTNGAGSTVGYTYNADGQATGITYPLPSGASWPTTDTVGYSYDHADQLTAVTDFNGNQITVGDTADGLPNSEALGSTGDTITTSYAANDIPSAISLKNSGSTLQSFTYSDSPAGTISSETDTPSSSLSPADYTYDNAGRVTSMTPGTGSTLSYSTDASGNLTTLPTGASGSYDNAGEVTSSILSGTTTSYSYNADGERLDATVGSTTVASGTWNGAGHLTSYSDGAANMSSASYDGNGLRASATTGSGTQQFTWNVAAQIPQLLTDSASAYIYTGLGTAPAEQVNLSTGAITYLVTDALGSARGIVSSSGSLTATTSYDAWGNPETSGGLAAYTPFGYVGGYTDPTGLVYLDNRYYDPATGQFTSVDPDLSDTLQPYAYASDDPVILADPTGLAWWDYGTDVQGCMDFCFTQYFDFSATFALMMRGTIEPKHGQPPVNLKDFLRDLVAALGVWISHNRALVVVGAVAVLVIYGKRTVKAFYKFFRWLLKRYTGKHRPGKTGFWGAVHWNAAYGFKWSGGAGRRCQSDKLTCGSTGTSDWVPASGVSAKAAMFALIPEPPPVV